MPRPLVQSAIRPSSAHGPKRSAPSAARLAFPERPCYGCAFFGPDPRPAAGIADDVSEPRIQRLLPSMKLSEIATALNARLVGDGTIEIDRPVHPADAQGPRDLALAMEPALIALLDGSPVRAAVVRDQSKVPADRLEGCIVVGRSRYAMSRLLDIFDRPPHIARGVDKMAVVADGARLGKDVSIGPFCYVGPKARIGDGTILIANVTVGAEATVGQSCLFHAGARIGERVVVGNRVIIHHNANIGADGFSFVT